MSSDSGISVEPDPRRLEVPRPEPISRDDRLNLGCGHNQRDGWTNVDVDEVVDPDRVVDLSERPWPWATDSVEHVRAQHLLEHLPDAVESLSEVARVLEPGGTFELVYPIGHTRFEDPTHKQIWNVNTAKWIGGGGEHSRELGLPFESEQIDVRLRHSLPEGRWLIRGLSWLRGVGPWVEQVPGVFGEVHARYRLEVSEK